MTGTLPQSPASLLKIRLPSKPVALYLRPLLVCPVSSISCIPHMQPGYSGLLPTIATKPLIGTCLVLSKDADMCRWNDACFAKRLPRTVPGPEKA